MNGTGSGEESKRGRSEQLKMIPLQLQQLFTKLQLLDTPTVSTKVRVRITTYEYVLYMGWVGLLGTVGGGFGVTVLYSCGFAMKGVVGEFVSRGVGCTDVSRVALERVRPRSFGTKLCVEYCSASILYCNRYNIYPAPVAGWPCLLDYDTAQDVKLHPRCGIRNVPLVL